MKYIKVYYVKAIVDLSLKEFNVYVLEMQKQDNKYGDYIAGQYYLFLTRS